MSRQQRTTGADVFARTVPMTVERHSFGEHRKADINKVETQTDKRLLSLSKRLINSPELRGIRQRDRDFREALNATATPFRPGFYLVPLGLVERVHAEAERWERERGELADAAAAAYPAQVEAMREPLGEQFDPRNYPRVDRFRACFWVDWRFIDMGVPNVLRELRADLFRREAEKVERLGQQARGMVEQHLLTSLKDITDHLHGLLQPREDGRPRQIRATALDDLTEFLATVEARNITGHADLRLLTQRLRSMGSGLSVELLRDDADLREATARQLDAVRESLGELVESQPDRAIRIRDEEAVGA